MTTTTVERSDQQLRRDVLAALRYEPRIDEVQIGVAVQSGVVTLTGEVASYREQLCAVEAAKRVAGVHAVVTCGLGVRTMTNVSLTRPPPKQPA